MVSPGKQLMTLFWKNAKNQQRQIVWTVLEFLLPTIFAAMTVIVRQMVHSTDHSTGILYSPMALDSLLFWPNQLAYHPKTPQTERIMNRAAQLLVGCNLTSAVDMEILQKTYGVCPPDKRLPFRAIGGFESESAMISWVTSSFQGNKNSPVLGAVVFKSLTEPVLSYDIRLGATARNPLTQQASTAQYKPMDNPVGWMTDLTYPLLQLLGPRSPYNDSFDGAPGYYYEGFLSVQRAVDGALTEWKTGQSLSDRIQTLVWRFPYPKYVDDQFILVIQADLPLVLMLGFLFATLMTTRNIVIEKEKRLKEFMKVMGLSNWCHWVAHFLWNLVFLMVPVVILTTIFCAKFGAHKVLEHSDASVIFLFILLYTVSMICYCFAISVFFTKGNTAAAVAAVLWFVTYLPYFFIQPKYATLSYTEKVASSLFMNTGFAMGAQIIGMWEGIGRGIQWSNLRQPASIEDNFSMADAMGLMMFDSLVCLLITWYVEGVKPGDLGQPLPWYFPFTLSYWKPAKRSLGRIQDMYGEENSISEHVEDVSCFEADPKNLDAVIQIRGLKKNFRINKTIKTAVNGIYLNMYRGQVTALLGHNGAGKTTTMSMLTGLIPATSGTSVIDGYDMNTNMHEIRKVLGLCPQYNVLFNNLTVEEHLIFFAKMKGSLNIKFEVDRMLESLRMEDKRKSLSKTLSGGMKRKLSVGIALIGGSSVVMLDEPTAGMDPGARRSTWDLIQRERIGRSIILTTHYMEEADLLGDRIAIMADGNIKCCGSSLFLKNRYGAGYHLTIVFHPGFHDKVHLITKIVHDYVPSARLDTVAGLQATYILPQNSVTKFDAMFQEMEEKQEELGVSSFGASVTTMEEVFLRVGEQAAEKEESVAEAVVEVEPDSVGGDIQLLNPDRNTGWALLVQQFRAMLLKRILHSIRNWKMLIPQLLVPVGLMILVLFVNKSLPNGSASPPLILNIDPFQKIEPQTVSWMYNTNSSSVNLGKFFVGKWCGICMATTWAYDVCVFSQWIPRSANVLMLYLLELLVTGCQIVESVSGGKSVTNRGLGTAYSRSFAGVKRTKSLCVNDELRNSFWSPKVNFDPTTRAAFKTNAFGLQSYISYLAEIYGQVFEKGNVLASYFQLGSALTSYASYLQYLGDNIKTLAVFTEPQWEQVRELFIPALRALQNGYYSRKNVDISAVAFFNGQPYHGPPVALNAMDTALLQYFSGKPSLRIQTRNYPLPPTSTDQIAEFRNKQVLVFDVPFSLLLGLSVLTSTFVLFLIKERVTKAKHLQYVSGVHPVNFWLSTFTWDVVNFLLPVILILVVFAAFSVEAYTSDNNLGYVFFLLILYLFGGLAYMYVASFLFSNPTVGFVKMTIFNILLGPGCMVIIGILEIPQLNLLSVRDALVWLFMALSPHFCLGQGLRQFGDNYLSLSTCEPLIAGDFCKHFPSESCCPGCSGGLCLSFTKSYMEWNEPGIGRQVFFLFLHALVFTGILMLHEMGYIRWLEYQLRTKRREHFGGVNKEGKEEDSDTARADGRHVELRETDSISPSLSPSSVSSAGISTTSSDEGLESPRRPVHKEEKDFNFIHDRDVSEEQTRVETRPIQELYAQGGAVIMDHLTKMYDQFLAVKSLSLCVERGECFGLLGVNGAGKTTTFKMLTGDEPITEGDAFINGFSVKNNLKKAQTSLGYCPQFDALIDQMTGYETIQMYARLRGIPERSIPALAEQLISLLNLEKHRTNLAGQFSGGNKRKLSIALSLIGNPAVILLDEPTNGIDPHARQSVWRLLAKVRQSGIPIILTSHGMEECEALCTRLAIMVGGRFKCLGSPQHLKHKFGTGYTVLLKVNRGRRVQKAVDTICELFPGTTVKDIHQRLVHFHVPSEDLPWSKVFGSIEESRHRLHVVDYSVAQTSLEQIFLNFSREQDLKTRDTTGNTVETE